jgi:hypothetical protein
MEYFALSHNIFTWQMNILRIFYDMAWNIFQRILLAHENLFICSLASVIDINGATQLKFYQNK